MSVIACYKDRSCAVERGWLGKSDLLGFQNLAGLESDHPLK
jgi:hypothetical protein